MFSDIKFEDDLVLNFNMTGFGPQADKVENNEFDGKLFKPYNKKEKITRLSEYNLMPQQIGLTQPSAAAQAQKNKQDKQAQLNTELVEANDDMGFTTVEETNKALKPK